MKSTWMALPLSLPLVLVAVTGGSEAQAGKNAWTHAYPHPKDWQGFKVTCARGTRRCSHGAPALIYQRKGLRFVTSARVTRLRRSFAVRVQVVVSVIDGQRHGLISKLSLNGRARPIIRRRSYSIAFRGLFIYRRHLPQLLPGQRRVLQAWVPPSTNSSGVTRGYQLTVQTSMAGLVHYSPRRHYGTPQVAIVVLTVPHKGPPLIRYKLPSP